jgi:hypothetical protein
MTFSWAFSFQFKVGAFPSSLRQGRETTQGSGGHSSEQMTPSFCSSFSGAQEKEAVSEVAEIPPFVPKKEQTQQSHHFSCSSLQTRSPGATGLQISQRGRLVGGTGFGDEPLPRFSPTKPGQEASKGSPEVSCGLTDMLRCGR